MENVNYIALHTQSIHLWDTYFIGVAHAPVMYLTLGRSVEKVAFALEQLCMESTHPSSRTFGPMFAIVRRDSSSARSDSCDP